MLAHEASGTGATPEPVILPAMISSGIDRRLALLAGLGTLIFLFAGFVIPPERRPLTTPLGDDDPGERWALVRVTLPGAARAAQVRIVAVDGTTGPRGWLGFSPPFLLRGFGSGFGTLLRLLSTFAASLYLVFGTSHRG